MRPPFYKNMNPVIVISGAAVAAGLVVAVAIKKPVAFALGLGAAALYYAVTRSEAARGLRDAENGGVEEITLGAQRNTFDGGAARMHGPEESAKVDPSLYPVPFRVKERKFWEDPSDDRIRWATTGPEGPYTAWRRGFF